MRGTHLLFVLLFLGWAVLGISLVLQIATWRMRHQQQQQDLQQQYVDEMGRCVAQRCGPMFSTEPPTDELLGKRAAARRSACAWSRRGSAREGA